MGVCGTEVSVHVPAATATSRLDGPHPDPGSAAAGVVSDQQGVVAVSLQQVEQEEPVSVGVQAHGPHALWGQGGFRAPCHLTQRLEDPVVLLKEKPGTGQRHKAFRGRNEISVSNGKRQPTTTSCTAMV